ncbi:VHS domain containing protein [Entamoeba histolytica HM-3:IMSS]|uniref:VHS domain containing protein n=6 Tax=Entamoeba histolytica TaxID=5759 RepID=C4LXU1_ENTH1|nr:VHS domain containing protein [Entamoeba histolytica HM-1:IMSS]EMD44098.1 VHS domain containing protein [Entamoeba histolytica KU27]EMS12177.1 VHS domain containing protein [Entamoeba histolytica HM-3:IMSS]ENY63823.1 VHS domain containing protein [Entamoeba histolytica HM-1:IMSS-A]GAT93592.1 vhs domain containing protein [Entamoeba histolytica]EAL45969.2 VHS domain containing protein [Entamoeba histolytica HM-1:IMSS]|eukprot:XP_651355.2 VHS domain containing protein [Entamoeba histolytica HM-1:IMSS]
MLMNKSQKSKTPKRKITWDLAAQLIEYATAADLKIIDEPTNLRICNLLKANKNKAKDLLNVLRKRMLNKRDNVVYLSLVLLQQTIIECPELIDLYSTSAWQDCFITTLLRTNVLIETKKKLLSIIRGMTESFPNDLLFKDTYEQIIQHGIDFPEAAHFDKEVTFVTKISKSKFIDECEQLIGYCQFLNQSFDYLTILELEQLKEDMEIKEIIFKLEKAQPIIISLLRKKDLSMDVIQLVKTTHEQIKTTLERHKKLTEKWVHLACTDKKIVENTQFMFESKKLR